MQAVSQIAFRYRSRQRGGPAFVRNERQIVLKRRRGQSEPIQGGGYLPTSRGTLGFDDFSRFSATIFLAHQKREFFVRNRFFVRKEVKFSSSPSRSPARSTSFSRRPIFRTTVCTIDSCRVTRAKNRRSVRNNRTLREACDLACDSSLRNRIPFRKISSFRPTCCLARISVPRTVSSRPAPPNRLPSDLSKRSSPRPKKPTSSSESNEICRTRHHQSSPDVLQFGQIPRLQGFVLFRRSGVFLPFLVSFDRKTSSNAHDLPAIISQATLGSFLRRETFRSIIQWTSPVPLFQR